MTAGALIDHRLLEGANIYFPRPAVKLTFDVAALAGLPELQARRLGRALGLRTAAAGEPDTQQRLHFCARLVSSVTRHVARRGGITRLAVRTRPSSDGRHVVVAVPWRHTGKVSAFSTGVSEVLAEAGSSRRDIEAALVRAGQRLALAEPGGEPELIVPHVPVVGVTGTNGKTTTSRMISHVAAVAGAHVAWSSTEGVHHDGVQILDGDYSGPGGARAVFACDPLDLAVAETARGGILRRGIVVSAFDVTVVTNISSDHLGMDGVDTLDQLAEVKSVLVQVTDPRGYTVLNGDDPRVLAMRHVTKARPWVFSIDPASPSLRTALDEQGRATTVLDGNVVALAGGDPVTVVALEDVPQTLAGLSRAHIENTLGVVSACLALGFTPEQVRRGVTDFVPEQHNPGRMAIWLWEGRSLVFDLAHNEAGLVSLLDICTGLRGPGAKLLVNLAVPGDRDQQTFRRIGELGGLHADELVYTTPTKYLRGADPAVLESWLREGIEATGTPLGHVAAGEVESLEHLLDASRPGDVVGFMCHESRDALKTWVRGHGGHPASHDEVRALVRSVRERRTTQPRE